jgi:hypothetical protein
VHTRRFFIRTVDFLFRLVRAFFLHMATSGMMVVRGSREPAILPHWAPQLRQTGLSIWGCWPTVKSLWPQAWHRWSEIMDVS